MITLKQWDAHPSFHKDLEVLLNHEVFVKALEIVLNTGITPTPVPHGVDLIHFAALTGARKEGYVEAILNLKSLAQSSTARPPARQPWQTPVGEKPKPET